MEPLDFGGVAAASEYSMTSPGTRGIFVIDVVAFGTSKEKSTPFMELTFVNKAESTSFRHKFYLTAGALPRIQYLHVQVNGSEITAGSMDQTALEAKLTAAFKGKEVALKTTGQVNEDNGKAYVDLPYSGFAKPAAAYKSDPNILKFTPQETGLVNEALAAMTKSRPQNADTESSNTGSASGSGAAPKKLF